MSRNAEKGQYQDKTFIFTNNVNVEVQICVTMTVGFSSVMCSSCSNVAASSGCMRQKEEVHKGEGEGVGVVLSNGNGPCD
jgi:hypothetical protein